MNSILSPLSRIFRPLARKPGFAIAVIVILALGIGINVATLGLIYRYYISPLPYSQGNRIISIYIAGNNPELAKIRAIPIVTWMAMQKSAPALSDSGVYFERDYNLALGNHERRVNGVRATGSVFSILGVQPALGQVFSPASSAPGAAPVVVLSYRLWQTLFNGKASAIGASLKLDGKRYTVIGIMPKGFAFPTRQTALWTPRTIPAMERDIKGLTAFDVRMVGRLADGATIPGFLSQANVILKNQIAAFPNQPVRAELTGLDMRIAAQGWRTSQLGNLLKQSLVLMLCATLLLMLLIWFNLANLSLVRSFARRGEWAIRRTLGASTARLIWPLAMRHLILGLAGAMGGVMLGRVLLDSLAASPVVLRASAIGSASWPALITIALVLGVISAIIFTVVCLPFLRGLTLSAALRDTELSASSGPGTKKVRVSLITGQIALACSIIGIGLLLGRSLLNLNAVQLGFNPTHVTTFRLSFPESQYSAAQMTAGLGNLRRAVSELPGVEAASLSSSVPFDGQNSAIQMYPSLSHSDSRISPPLIFTDVADDAYIKTLGMQLLEGRGFVAADDQANAAVVIIDTLAAKQLFGSQDVLGREFGTSTDPRLFRVVGVVKNVRRSNLSVAETQGTAYLDFGQSKVRQRLNVVSRAWYLSVRAPLATTAVISEVRGVSRNIIPGVPLYDIQTMDQRVAASLASNRLLTALVLLFAVGALVLAAVGLYALQAYSVAQRSREFAIRASLGATQNRLIAQVLGETARLLVIGLVVGLAGLAAIGVAFASAFYGIGAVDPASMLAVVVVLTLAALAASWIPAWRASRVEPNQALRNT